MISDPVIAKHYHKAQRTLKSSRNKNKAMDRIIEEGISEIEAVRIVDYVYDDNIQANRKLGIYYFIAAGAGTIALLLVWAMTDRLYYIALPIAGIAAIMGFFQLAFPSGYSVMIPTESESD
jgi:hypothetical protein